VPVKKTVPKGGAKVKATVKTKPSAEDVALPTERSAPSKDLQDYTWLIYGEKKIGKTSLVSHFPDVLFTMFEPGGKALKIFQTETLTDWGKFLAYVKKLKNDKHNFKTLCIDPGNQAYDRCLDYIVKNKLGGMHPGKIKDYGASWKAVSSEFQRVHSDIASTGMGFLVLAHAKTADVETRTGETFSKVMPVLSGSTEEFYAGIIDNIAYYHYVGKDRYLQIRGDDFIQAGTRCEENFLTIDGEPIVRIPMGGSSKEAFKNLTKAFANKQTDSYADVLVRTAPSGVKRKAPKKK